MIPTPAELVAELDKYVVGQDKGKRTLATAVHSHYLNVAYQGPVRIKKANVLLLGPTGCLAGESLVETDRGLQRIDHLSYVNVRTSAGVLAPAAFFWKGRTRLYRVRHQHGSFSATAEHRLLAGRGGAAMWRSVGGLHVGDALIERSPEPFGADRHPSSEGPSRPDVTSGADHSTPWLQALEYGALECPPGMQASRILSITFDREDDYFDGTVPGWSNYRANGVIHHNSGKTYMCETIARTLDVPFESITATAITPSGWIGDKAETVVERMYQRAKARWGKEAFAKAQLGIAYVDEVDKLAVRGQQPGSPPGMSGDQHFNTTQIQQALLRVIEGVEIRLDGNPFPTDRILFVASGAFIGLERIVQRRESGGRPTRAALPAHPLRSVVARDLVEYGFLPEFVGRFPVTVALDALAEGDLVAIVRDVRDSLIAQKRAMLSVRGCDIDVEEAVLRNIARAAIAQGTGARGLQTMVEKLLEPLLYDLLVGTLLRITPEGVRRERVVSEDGASASSPDRSGEPAASLTPEGL